MKVVVTGASGNVGTALLRAAPDWEVVAVARRVPPPLRPYQRARWIPCDIGDPGADSVLTTACAGADAVVHLAWAIQPPRHDPAMSRTNRAGTAAVLRAVAQAGVPQVVSASSVAAYSPAPRWDSVTEDHRTGGIPGSAYSADKAAVETLLDEFEATHPAPRVARVRPCAVAQRDAGAQLARWALSPLVPRAVLGNRLLPVPLWPDLRMQVVHSADVADAIRRIVTIGATGAFNLAADPGLRTTDLATVLGGFEVTLPRALLTTVAAAAWRVGLQAHAPRLAAAGRRRAAHGVHPGPVRTGLAPQLGRTFGLDGTGHGNALRHRDCQRATEGTVRVPATAGAGAADVPEPTPAARSLTPDSRGWSASPKF